MSTQPEALRLADAIDYSEVSFGIEAAAELRRLAAENESLKAERDEDRRRNYGYSQQGVDALTKERDVLRAQRDALLEALEEADDLLRIARGAMWKLGLNGLGSDCRLSHEVRMFALDFSAESRDGPGVLQVNGTGRLQKALASIRAAIKAAEEWK